MRRLFVILLAACQTQPAEGTATPTPTVNPAPTVTPTVTPMATLSPEEQRDQALRQALAPEVYANLAEYGLLDRADLDRKVLSLPVFDDAPWGGVLVRVDTGLFAGGLWQGHLNRAIFSTITSRTFSSIPRQPRLTPLRFAESS